MLRRWINIALGKSATAIRQDAGRYFRSTELAGYYNDLTGKIGSGTLVDKDGIPLSQIGKEEFAYFPIAIFQYGLGMYDLLLAGDARADRAVLDRIACWALKNQRADGSWDCFGPVKSRCYTVSSMGQGEGASFLFRMWKLSGEEAFLHAGFKAVDCMLRSYEEGGTAILEGNSLFLEEYPQHPRRTVMNGWIFSIFGLYDATLLDPARYQAALFQTVNTLKCHLSDYDTGYWSRYDVSGRIASPAYHSLHIAQLTVLGQLLDEPAFNVQAEKYAAYAQKKTNRVKAITLKVVQKLLEKSDAVFIK
jgi:hypothetical protein